MEWCEPEELLCSLYAFAHRECSSLQSVGAVNAFCGLLSRFVGSLEEQAQAGQQPPWLSPGDLLALCHAVRLVSSSDSTEWFPGYGCALLALRPPGETIQAMPASLSLVLIGLDLWSFRVHSTSQGNIQHTSSCEGGTLLPLGMLPASDFLAFKRELHSRLSSAALRKGDERSAAGSRQGHQRTPALVHALALESMELTDSSGFAEEEPEGAEEDDSSGGFRGGSYRASAFGSGCGGGSGSGIGGGGGGEPRVAERLPMGGFRDVGRHTGGRPLDTAWPLVRETVKSVLSHSGACQSCITSPELPQLFLAHLHLWLLQRQLALLSPENATSAALSAVMQMLQATASCGSALAGRGHDVSALEAACCGARRVLDAAAAARAERAAAAATLQPLGGGAGCWRRPRGVVPRAAEVRQEGGDPDQVWQRVTANLGSLPLPPLDQPPPQQPPQQPAPPEQPPQQQQQPAGMDWQQAEPAGSASTAGSAGGEPAALAPPAPPPMWPEGLLCMLREKELQPPLDAAAAQHALCAVERELFQRAVQAGWAGAGAGAGGGGTGAVGAGSTGGGTRQAVQQGPAGAAAAAAECLSQQGVESLVAVVDAYRTVLHGFLAAPASTARLRVELHSRELLVVWTALCLAHAAGCAAQPALQEFGVGVRWQDLRHCVLSDRLACDALLAVAAYLRTNCAPGREAFSLRDGGRATFALAAQHAGQDKRLLEIWGQESEAAEARRAAHWAAVERKQAAAAALRERLAAQREAEVEAEAALRRAEAALCESRYQKNQQLAACRSELAQARSERQRLESELRLALEPPPPVIQPLPAQPEAALTWLFFLYMPPILRHLSRLTFLAQQLLLPWPPPGDTAASAAVARLVAAAAPKCSLADHYNDAQCGVYHPPTGRCGNEGRVLLVSDGKPPEPDRIRPSTTVDGYFSSQQGVWHPDNLPLRLAWQGSGGPGEAQLLGGPGGPSGEQAWLDPFAEVPDSLRVEAFTELLPEGARALQWALPQYGSRTATPLERGNLALARQDERPLWLSKPGFLAFGTLRAYPLIQMRKLCVALAERPLPLGRREVQTLIRQALYHCGTLTDTPQPTLLWRTDWVEGAGASSSSSSSSSSSRGSADPSTNSSIGSAASSGGMGKGVGGGLLGTLCSEIASLAAELEQSPREHAAVAFLGEIAAFLGSWHPPLAAIAKRLAGTACRWAEELEGSIGRASPDEARPLRAKQCLLRGTALLCYATGGELGVEDAEEMLGLAVQVRHGSVYAQELPSQEERERFGELQVLCQWALARRMHQLLPLALAHRPILTSALRRVLQRAPPELPWKHLGWWDRAVELPAASFQAEGSDGRLYAINCLTGTVLEDGAPPGRLPSEILTHPLYQRTFGGWGFEVSKTAAGVHRTITPLRGRFFYEFALSHTGSLLVEEVDEESGGGSQACRRLQLLDGGEGQRCIGWGEELPRRLREMHSAWLSREERAIVLRPPHFRDRQCFFILQWDPPPPPGPSQGIGRGMPGHPLGWAPPPHSSASTGGSSRWQAGAAGAALHSQQAQAAAAAGAAVEYVCRRVPTHLRIAHWAELLLRPGTSSSSSGSGQGGSGEAAESGKDSCTVLAEQLVIHESRVTEVLSKFESRDFIHVYALAPATASSTLGISAEQRPSPSTSSPQMVSPPSSLPPSQPAITPARDMLFELPRFGLEIELRGGQLRSLDYSGCMLAACQQLWDSAQEGPGGSAAGWEAAAAASLGTGAQDGTSYVPPSSSSPGNGVLSGGGSLACSYTLPNFRQYLVLEREAPEQGQQQQQQGQQQQGGPQSGGGGGASSTSTSSSSGGGGRGRLRRMVLVPVGEVCRSGDEVAVKHDERSAAELKAYSYEVHPRFGHLVSPSVPARLQLAALYGATGSLLPEPGSQLTGAQQAMALLRQCWGVRPLSAGDAAALAALAKLGGNMAAGLRLLAHELLASAAQLNALYFAGPHAADVPQHSKAPKLDPDWALAYLQEAECRQQQQQQQLELESGLGGGSAGGGSAAFPNARLLLSHGEEQRALGYRRAPAAVPLWRQLRLFREIEVPACPVAPETVPLIEAQLLQLVAGPGEGSLPKAGANGGLGGANDNSSGPQQPAVPQQAEQGQQQQAAPQPQPLAPQQQQQQSATAGMPAPQQFAGSGGSWGRAAGSSVSSATLQQRQQPPVEAQPLESGMGSLSLSSASQPPQLQPASQQLREQQGQQQGQLSSGAPAPPYPLWVGSRSEAGTTPLEEQMHAELRDSWKVHHSTPVPAAVVPGARQCILETQEQVRQQRQQVQDYLTSQLAAISNTVGLPGASFRLLRASASVPQPGALDLVRLALPTGAATAAQFNPFLSPAAAAALQAAARTWLQLCVLEDRLGRLEKLAGDAAALPLLIQELQVRRQWSVDRHPEWLVFEAEQQLQIRPAQHWVADYLIRHPGSLEAPGAVIQLNMGEGKTRVILPMLILHWANGQELVRLNLLPALLEEGYAHLHACLCASVMSRRLFVLPFHRDVKVTQRVVEAAKAALAYCKQEGGVLLTTPERRLSLLLKRQELWQQGQAELCAALDALLQQPAIDLLDESDELLSHRYQLIYACGSPTELPSEQARARAGHALLQLLSRHARARGSALGSTLAREGVAVRAGPADKPGAFRGVRLLPGEALERALPSLRRQLAQAVVEDPPYAMRWMRRHPEKGALVRCISNPLVGAARLLEEMGGPGPTLASSPGTVLGNTPGAATSNSFDEPQPASSSSPAPPLGMAAEPSAESLGESSPPPSMTKRRLTEEERLDVLALRGLLACGVLEHCLALRHLVDYGVNRTPTARKRLAVPFRAAHVPSERAEYAQPDTALTLTALSYYYDGLSRAELMEALGQLLRLGRNAQRAYYAEWLTLAADGSIPPAELEAVDDVNKLDTTNMQQMDLLHRHFSHNMAAINFWLSFCVVPSETQQYPHRLVANAWHLADNPRGAVCGFSGTNDNHRLLPLQVEQHLDVERGLRATNGKMLAVILDNPQYHTLQPAEGEPMWQALLRFAVSAGSTTGGTTAGEGLQSVHALVDCGALLAGTSNRSAAEFLLPLLDRQAFKGVCYFDEQDKAWMVLDLQSRRLPRHSSPIQEAQAFTLFDEARCRGADLQLRGDAVGLLTLGPTTTKDKLMQAAGRLRKLGKGQRLRIVGTADVTARIAKSAGSLEASGSSNSSSTVPGSSGGSHSGDCSGTLLTSRHVLQWVMQNTVQATLRGVLEYTHQGLLFAATRGAPEHALQPEVLQLGELYGGSRQRRSVAEVVREQAGRRHRPGLASEMQRLMERVAARGEGFGAGHEVAAAGLSMGEECERELEREEEEEEEMERQVPRTEPEPEADWDYSQVLGACSAAELQQRTGLRLLPLPALAARLQPAAAGMGALPWAPGLYCTPNFVRCARQAPGEAPNEYLRPLDALLLLAADGDGNSVGQRSGGMGTSNSGSAAEGSSYPAIVLLSEREADGLLELLWQGGAADAACPPAAAAPVDNGGLHSVPDSQPAQPPPLLASLCYASQAQQAQHAQQQQQPAGQDSQAVPAAQPAPLPLAVALSAAASSSAAAAVGGGLAGAVQAGAFMPQLISLQLFNGETTYADLKLYGTEWEALRRLPQLRLLCALVRGQGAAAEALVGMRGKQVLWSRSQLELACDVDRRGAH